MLRTVHAIPAWLDFAVGGVALAWFVFSAGPSLLTRHPSNGMQASDLLKAQNDVRATLVQAIAGLALAGGLAFTYRSYKLNRSQQITDTYTRAVEQLGHQEAPVRLGALYSLQGIGQDNPPWRQTVIDVWCAYLRMPFSEATHSKDEGEGAPVLGYPATPPLSGPIDGAMESTQELQVRKAVQKLLTGRLRRPATPVTARARRLGAAPADWPNMDIDLTGAVLVDFKADHLTVAGATFSGARFVGLASFLAAEFSSESNFDRVTFEGGVDFGGADFNEDVSFKGARFPRFEPKSPEKLPPHAPFASAKLRQVAGRSPAGSNIASFRNATFAKAIFSNAEFVAPASFDDAVFDGDAKFDSARLCSAFFKKTVFRRSAYFRNTVFTGQATFKMLAFPANVQFDNAEFVDGPPLFEQVRVENLSDAGYTRVWPAGWEVLVDADKETEGAVIHCHP